MYNKVPPKQGVYSLFFQILWKAITSKRVGKVEHWIDRAKKVYDEDPVEDVKSALRVLLVFV